MSLGSYARLLRRNRNFRRLWLAQIVSEIGDWFYTLSIYTLLLQFTGHAGSVALVFSTTLLQFHSEDRFRGRVFSADLGLASFTFAVTAYLAGHYLDLGVSVRTLSTGTGVFMLLLAGILAIALWTSRSKVSAAT